MKLKVLSILTLTMLASTLLGLKPIGASGETVLYVDPLLISALPDETFTVNITVADVEHLYAWQVNMSFDSNELEFVNVTEGDFLKSQPEGAFGVFRLDHIEEGWALFGWTTIGPYLGVKGSGTLAVVEFSVVKIGNSIISIDHSETYLLGIEEDPLPPPPIFAKISCVKQNGYFIGDPYWAELFDLYTQLLDWYDQLLDNYNILLANYTTLLTDYDSLNSSYYSLLAEYQDLQSKYDELELDYTSLNATYTSLLHNHTQLQRDNDSLQSAYDNLNDSYYTLATDYDSLQESYNSLEATYNSLNSTYNSLQADYDDLESKYETSTGELGATRNLNYVLIVTIVVFVGSTTYLLIKKPKVKSI